ncbi:MAG TPA: hypothetical protein PLI95_25590 [Polyangiaceae bacterium]|nr:hypothetical protein [Polyangiaceae bacterium]
MRAIDDRQPWCSRIAVAGMTGDRGSRPKGGAGAGAGVAGGTVAKRRSSPVSVAPDSGEAVEPHSAHAPG